MIISEPPFTTIEYPCGEIQVKIRPAITSTARVVWEYDGKNSEFIELALLADALKRNGYRLVYLHIPYLPFARQDRDEVDGGSFALKTFADLINGLGFENVAIDDPHSDVAVALINNVRVTRQDHIFEKLLPIGKPFTLVSPDGGALKKTYKLADCRSEAMVVECSKRRNTGTGALSSVHVHAKPEQIEGQDCYIVDDICDGGGTFVGIAQVLKQMGARKIVLMVTHGFFTKGLGAFDGLIDEIYTRKGRIK